MKPTRILATTALLATTLGCVFVHAQRQNANDGEDQALPKNQVSIEVRGDYRYIKSNGIPDHEPGRFPNRNNPGTIGVVWHSYRVPLHPKVTDKITPQLFGSIGIALNGIPFDPGTAEFWNRDPNSGWRQAARAGTNDLGLDYSNAHVQPNGAYHYHGLPYGWLNKLPHPEEPQTVLTGYAADGFPIYALYGYTDAKDAKSPLKELRSSYRLKEGARPGGDDGPGGRYDGTYEQDLQYVAGSGDLDECNGRFGVTPEYPEGTYYYVLTKDYPYVPRAFRGTPDTSFTRRPPGGGPGGPGGGPGGGRGPGGPGGGPPPPWMGP